MSNKYLINPLRKPRIRDYEEKSVLTDKQRDRIKSIVSKIEEYEISLGHPSRPSVERLNRTIDR